VQPAVNLEKRLLCHFLRPLPIPTKSERKVHKRALPAPNDALESGKISLKHALHVCPIRVRFREIHDQV
jgi:hypothetical protein